jgi:hypothetical protein
MPSTTTKASPTLRTRTTTTPGAVARWMVSFAGFPLGGLAAMLLVGPINSTSRAAAGGLLTGAVLGAAQAWSMRADRRQAIAWIVSTAVGLSIGLAIGGTVARFGTDLGDLAVQGAISGLAIGAAQTTILIPRFGAIAFAWPFYLAAAWTAGWAITTSVGVQVEDQFTVFGAAGAVIVTLVTVVLPVLITSRSQHQ